MAGKRKLIFYGATSVDGFIARLDGSVDWLDRPQPKGDYGMAAFYRSADTVVLGRKPYDLAVKHGLADVAPGKKTYVFTRTLKTAASPKVSLVTEDPNAFAKRLRNEKGKNIWLMGGAELLASFLDCGQVNSPQEIGTTESFFTGRSDCPRANRSFHFRTVFKLCRTDPGS